MSRALYRISETGYPAFMLSPKPTLAELLTHHYLEYQKRSGGMKKLKQFAEYLEIHEVTLNRLINGKRNAGPAMLVRLGKKLEDPRFYELAMARGRLSVDTARSWSSNGGSKNSHPSDGSFCLWDRDHVLDQVGGRAGRDQRGVQIKNEGMGLHAFLHASTRMPLRVRRFPR